MSDLNIQAISLSEDATEADLAQYMVAVRKQVKRWQAKHKDSLLGENISYGIKAACNMAYSGESMSKNINDVVVEKCSLGL